MGETLGVGAGFIWARDSVAGNNFNADANLGLISPSVSLDSSTHEMAGAALTFGPGVGGAISQTDTDPLITAGDILHHLSDILNDWLSPDAPPRGGSCGR